MPHELLDTLDVRDGAGDELAGVGAVEVAEGEALEAAVDGVAQVARGVGFIEVEAPDVDPVDAGLEEVEHDDGDDGAGEEVDAVAADAVVDGAADLEGDHEVEDVGDDPGGVGGDDELLLAAEEAEGAPEVIDRAAGGGAEGGGAGAAEHAGAAAGLETAAGRRHAAAE